MPKSEDEWKGKLTDEQYRVLREKGTEAPFSGEHLHEKRSGTFKCVACGQALFSSNAKFESGTGWPSFDQALPDAVEFRPDDSYGMRRTEVVCSKCKSHLGHIFDDGPTESGKRYCINSVCLGFDSKE
ncbi:MAG TPA: peptide-methionine (R)-S-oxide reductase MsrB [Candidatus Paceibacterota bacterium]|nr:peptide-methionine (R)-S-oxide reductase MsrB [Candidatus Paceibacterota bacterium]